MSEDISPIPPPTKPSRLILRVVSIVWLILFFPVSLMSMMSVMLFDAPGSENSPLTIIFAFCLMVAPLVLIISSIGGLTTSFKKDFYRQSFRAKIFAWAPVVNFGLFILIWILIDLVCDGDLVC